MVENIYKYLEMEILGNIWKYLLVENEKVLVGHTHTLVLLTLPVGIGFSGLFLLNKSSHTLLLYNWSTVKKRFHKNGTNVSVLKIMVAKRDCTK